MATKKQESPPSRRTPKRILLWVLGGVLALIGAFTFAELGTHYPDENGGDYIFISKGLHPFLGYLSAWVSLVGGFSAPVAIAGKAMEAYLSPFGLTHPRALTVAIIVVIGVLHSVSLKQSSVVQNGATLIKIGFIGGILALGFGISALPTNALRWDTSYRTEVFTAPFAVSLLYVTYAYTGWNAAAYIVSEIRDPRRSLPRALLLGTIGVAVIYVCLQVAMLRHASLKQLQGQTDVAVIAFGYLLGPSGGRWVSAGIAFQLIATMSSYIWIGGRITQRMARDFPLWHFFGKQSVSQIPILAIWIQIAITLGLLFSGTLEQVLLCTSFVLQLMGTLAVASLLRTPRLPHAFHSPWRPWLQWGYISFSLCVLGFILTDRPRESLVGLAIVAVGGLTYWIRPGRP